MTKTNYGDFSDREQHYDPRFQRKVLWRILAFLAALILILLALTASAQDATLPERPKPRLNRKLYLFEVSALAAANAADLVTTRQSLKAGAIETNPIFGPHPSFGRQAPVMFAEVAGAGSLLYYTERSRRWPLRWAGRAVAVYLAGSWARNAIRNRHNTVECRHRPTGRCP